MDADTKYKRWGWGAIAGLIGIILIAGLIVAVTMSSPKPNTEVASDTTQTSVNEKIEAGNSEDGAGFNTESDAESGDASGKSEAERKAEEEKKAAEEKRAAEEKAAQEKAEAEAKAKEDAKKSSGNKDSSSANTNKMPKTGPEDNLVSIVALAVIAGLVVYNISLKRQA
jgi:membrane protein involved in colicin uptake